MTAAAVDSVNTFEAPNTVAPKPAQVKLEGQRLSLTLAPKSVASDALAEAEQYEVDKARRSFHRTAYLQKEAEAAKASSASLSNSAESKGEALDQFPPLAVPLVVRLEIPLDKNEFESHPQFLDLTS